MQKLTSLAGFGALFYLMYFVSVEPPQSIEAWIGIFAGAMMAAYYGIVPLFEGRGKSEMRERKD